MPIAVQDLMNDKRTIDVETKAGKMVVTYAPSRYVASRENTAMSYLETNRPLSSLAVGLAELLLAWDITGELKVGHDVEGNEDIYVGADGEVLPITLEVLQNLPGSLLILIQSTINEDMKPKSDELKNSGAGSRRKVN